MPSNEGRAMYNRILREDSHGCSTYHPGHQVHWIQAKKGLQDETRLPVGVHVEPDLGLVQFGALEDPLLYWTHNTARLAEALQGQDGDAIWSADFHLLAVPSGHGNLLFNLTRLDEVRPCRG